MKKSLLVLATLGFALSLNAADLTDTCKSYFSDIDKMVEAYKQAGQKCMKIKRNNQWIN